jgi:hypothetical protein
MGWEVRGGNRYYTRSRKVSGRVVREYVGGGAAGELAAAADALWRADRRAENEQRRAEDARWRTGSEALRSLCQVADLLFKATLLAAGYRQHHRSTWRKRRHGNDGGSPANGGGNPGAAATPGKPG